MILAARRYSAWVWLLCALVIVVALKLASASNPVGGAAFSVENAAPSGALAASLWLDRIGYHVERKTGPDLGLTRLRPGKDVLVIFEQGVPVSTRRADQVLSWVSRGGRAVLATDGSTGKSVVERLGGSFVPTDSSSVRVIQPLLLSPPVANLEGQAYVGVAVPNSYPAVRAQTAPVVEEVRYGRGRIWLISAPALATNAEIAHADNRRLLLNLVGPPGGVIAFDEYLGNGPGSGAAGDWLTGSEWGAAVLFTSLVLVLYRWLSGWRLGPPVIPLTDRHRPLTEYVVSMAGLMRRARQRDDVLKDYQRHLARAVNERHGLSAIDSLESESRRDEELARLIAPAGAKTDDELMRRVTDIVRYENKLSGRGD